MTKPTTVLPAAVYRCTGLKGSGKDGKCDETNPEKFLRGRTDRCLKCNNEYHRNWYHANKLGKKVSEVAVFGRPYHARVVIKGEKESTDEDNHEIKAEDTGKKERGEGKAAKKEKVADEAIVKKGKTADEIIAKKDKRIAKLERELEKANGKIVLLCDWMEQISISARCALNEADDSGSDSD